MNEMMTFPDTWEEFEKSYGFTDSEKVYTNGSRLIPSFRVKQWLDHLPSAQPERKNGEWEHLWDAPDGTYIGRCAKCGFVHVFINGHDAQYKYCPNCGADMRGGQDEAD